MVNGCWIGFKWAIALAVAAGAAAALFYYHHFDEQLRRHLEARIANGYPSLKVTLGSAEWIKGEGFRIRNLTIAEPGAEGPGAEILHIDEAMFECSTDWKQLVEGDPPIHLVKIHRPTLRMIHRHDGTWSASRLLPMPHLSGRPPEVRIESGVVEIFDPLKRPVGTHTFREVSLSLLPIEEADGGPALAAQAGPTLRNDPASSPQWRRLQGVFIGDGVRRVEIDGLIDMRSPACHLHGHAEGVELSPELRDSLPNPLASKLAAIGNLRGEAKVQFRVDHDPAAAVPLVYDISGELVRGRIDDSRLPHALTELSAKLHVDNSGYAIDDLVAQSGRGTIRLACRRSGFDAASPLWLTAEVRQLDLDRSLLAILPPALQDQWRKYLPEGEIDADLQVSFDGQSWRPPQLSVRCLDVAFTYYKFPYRMQHATGSVELKDDRLTMNIKAFCGSQPISLSSDFLHPFDGPIGSFEARGDNIQLDESLLAALPDEKSRDVARSLDPRGAVNFVIQTRRDKPGEAMHQLVRLSANRCSIRYNKFPYPISNIQGTLEMRDGVWTLSNIEGSNDKAQIKLKGSFGPGLEGNELTLGLIGKDVPLQKDLRDALSPTTGVEVIRPVFRQLWHDIQPQGTVDVAAEVRYLAEQKKFSVTVSARPQPKSVSIELVRFPYRLDHLQGVLEYSDGHVTIKGFKAKHGDATISAEAACDFMPDGRWTVQFTNLWADRLMADRELTQALPPRLRGAIESLKPSGPINLNGNLTFNRTGPATEPLQSSWNVRVGLQQSNVQFGGLPVENVNGVVALQGQSDGQHIQSRGELALDSASYRNCQATDVTGPIWIDDGQVLFGSWVDRRERADPRTAQPTTPRPITLKLFGGTLYADGWSTFGADPLFGVSATLIDADLARCAREAAASRKQLRGRIVAWADVKGSVRSRNALSGKGRVELSDGNVYELPVMFSLLKLLSIRQPDQNAFSSAKMDYRIEGEHIYFDRIDFHGDAISLLGEGQMDFQQQLDLRFSTKLGRGEIDLPLINQFFKGASEQILVIHVGGTLQSPEPRREALPGVNHVLQQLTGGRP